MTTYFGVFSFFLGTEMVGVLLPYLSEKLMISGLGISEILYVSGLFIGILPFFTGYLSDKYGERKMILVCSPFIASSFIFYTLATNFTQLLLSRILYGISIAFCAPAFLALAGKSVKKFGGVGMGAFRASQGFAETVSPILGAILASAVFFNFPFYLSVMLVPLSAALIFIVGKEESIPRKSERKFLENLKM
jgi:MFS family permease